jgi:hypothetical protein
MTEMEKQILALLDKTEYPLSVSEIATQGRFDVPEYKLHEVLVKLEKNGTAFRQQSPDSSGEYWSRNIRVNATY